MKGYDCFKAMPLILLNVDCAGEGRDPGGMERGGRQTKKERAKSCQ